MDESYRQGLREGRRLQKRNAKTDRFVTGVVGFILGVGATLAFELLR